MSISELLQEATCFLSLIRMECKVTVNKCKLLDMLQPPTRCLIIFSRSSYVKVCGKGKFAAALSLSLTLILSAERLLVHVWLPPRLKELTVVSDFTA